MACSGISGAKARFVGLLCVVFTFSGLAWAQQPGRTIEEFKESLDPRVFQAGGYGPWSAPLNPVFDAAATTYDVPRELLLALGYLGSAFENRGDQPTIEYGYGVMSLRENTWGGDSLAAAANLLNTTSDAVKADPDLNIMGAAAVLDAWATKAGIDRKGGLDAWLPVVIRYAGLADEQSNRMFAGEVYSHLQSGFSVTNSYGEMFSFPPLDTGIDPNTLMPGSIILSTDYGPAVWDPAASCNYTATSTNKDTIIIHTVEGSYAGAISWFKNCSAQVSAHYVIAYDGRITQCVREMYKAWHVGCYNSRSIGLEHEGYASASSHPQTQYDASGDLAKDICNDWGVPKAHYTVGPGILGHIDVTNCCCGTHTDPGNGWDWSYYISRVNGAPPTPEWDATYANQSYPSSMEAGSTAIVWVEFNNTGTGHWRHAETRLGTSSPQDRSSPFCNTPNWVSCNRPTDVDQSDVAQGAVGRFTFILKAPTTPGGYVEKYKLVREGITWFGPEVTWNISVTASTGTITGTVRNASNSQAIAGATVTLSGVSSTTTNSSGVYTFSNVTAGSYSISASATGFQADSGSVSVTAGQTTTKDFALTPSDTQAPTTPTGLVANATGPTTVTLTWSPSTDNTGVVGYEIRRDGTTIGSSAGTSYTDTSATPNTTHSYHVRAKDAVPNYSAWSDPAEATTPPAPPELTLVFSDGFNGGLGNWTQQTQSFAYSTAVNHGTYTGGGAAYCGALESDQMYRAFARPFAQAKAWGWFYDSKGGWKAGVCGFAYRQSLSLRDTDGAAKFFVDNGFNSASDNSKYFYRLIGGGGGTHTPYATRNAATNCSGAWIYFETAVSPGVPGASPTGTFTVKVTDGAGTTSTTQNLSTDFESYGVGRITLGLGVSSSGESWWDDIALQAMPPDWPLAAAPEVLSTSQIRWHFAPRDNNFFGFDVTDEAGSPLAPQYPASGWLNRDATSWMETGLTANTGYTRKIRAWNGTLNSQPATAQAWALSVAPAADSVVPDRSDVCAGQNVIWSANGGFGAGKVQYYAYAWDQNASHTFNGAEPTWASGTLVLQATAPGTWYLHVKGFNGADVANGTYTYNIAAGTPAADITAQPAPASVCPGDSTQFTLGVTGDGLTYQWQKNGDDLGDEGHFSGTATPVLTITDIDTVDAGDYRCVVSNGCGSVTSDAAALSLKSATVITEQPQSQAVCPGTPLLLSVGAVGDGDVTYQWQRNGEDLPGATGPTFEIAAPTSDDAGEYICVITAGCGSVESYEAFIPWRVLWADFDGDCNVGLDDYALFEACAAGPAVPPAAGCTVDADYDDDGDVDQADFAEWQIEMTQSQ